MCCSRKAFSAIWGRLGRWLEVVLRTTGLQWQHACSNGTHALLAASISKFALQAVQTHDDCGGSGLQCRHRRPGWGSQPAAVCALQVLP